ncbi:conjugal transfer protein TraF [Marinobacter halotolerans]|uniref:conjugal transfer protein TraF n=1 Tax=Marinobacter halotolerans TaxID=1569211 RepID=UPI001CDA29E5|nr:conjugal transfer protein TraF [Marinobacter halotolerans]
MSTRAIPVFSRKPLAVALCLASASALASPQAFTPSRSFAMGGTGVAIAHPAAAGASNPAMMASEHHDWSDDFGLIFPSVNARFADEEETVDQIDGIQDVIDQFEQAQQSSNLQDAQDAAGDLRERLAAFDRDTVRIDAGVGIALAVPTDSYSVGFFTSGNVQAAIRGEYDESDDATLAALESGDLTAIQNANLDDLRSRGRVLASGVAEAGISVSTSFELTDGTRFQVGVSPKYVQLVTYQYTESVSGFEDDNAEDEEYETEKSGFNLDIGAAYAFGEENAWNAGVVVKNLIPMELESNASSDPLKQEQKYTLELDPMLTAGIAHTGDFHVVTAELDLTKKKGFGYADDTQWLAVGAELDAWRYAQIRFGVRQNLASNDDNNGIAEETQFTAGIGLSVFGARLDLGALVSDAEMGAALELGAAF